MLFIYTEYRIMFVFQAVCPQQATVETRRSNIHAAVEENPCRHSDQCMFSYVMVSVSGRAHEGIHAASATVSMTAERR